MTWHSLLLCGTQNVEVNNHSNILVMCVDSVECHELYGIMVPRKWRVRITVSLIVQRRKSFRIIMPENLRMTPENAASWLMYGRKACVTATRGLHFIGYRDAGPYNKLCSISFNFLLHILATPLQRLALETCRGGTQIKKLERVTNDSIYEISSAINWCKEWTKDN